MLKIHHLIALIGAALAVPAVAQSSDNAASAAPAAAPAPVANDGPIGPPPAGQGQIVFFRGGSLMGAAISCAVSENGVKLNSLYPGRYFRAAAGPGVHSFSVSSESTDTLRMEIESGETYYVQCAIGMGIVAGRPNLSPSDKAKFMSKKLKEMGVR